jgi:hypothetical protein
MDSLALLEFQLSVILYSATLILLFMQCIPPIMFIHKIMHIFNLNAKCSIKYTDMNSNIHNGTMCCECGILDGMHFTQRKLSTRQIWRAYSHFIWRWRPGINIDCYNNDKRVSELYNIRSAHFRDVLIHIIKNGA